jgi:hypothetical protein
MAETEKPKTLEMRVAELEDKLSKMHISEEEMKTYQKVAAALGGGAPGAQPSLPPVQSLPTYYNYCRYYSPCYYRVCYYQVCYYQADCIPAQQGPVMPMGGGFGSFGQ